MVIISIDKVFVLVLISNDSSDKSVAIRRSMDVQKLQNIDFSENHIYRCTFEKCDKKYKKRDYLRKHMKSAHANCIYKCLFENCKKTYTKTASMTSHTKFVHKNNKYTCNICDYKASTILIIDAHKQNIHEGKKFHCNLCNTQFNLKLTLNNHIKRIHKGNQFSCNRCFYKCNVKGDFKKHVLNVHEGIKNKKCPQCDYKTSESSGLNVHIMAIHEKIVFDCNECGFSTNFRAALRRHKKTQHNEVKHSVDLKNIPKTTTVLYYSNKNTE